MAHGKFIRNSRQSPWPLVLFLSLRNWAINIGYSIYLSLKNKMFCQQNSLGKNRVRIEKLLLIFCLAPQKKEKIFLTYVNNIYKSKFKLSRVAGDDQIKVEQLKHITTCVKNSCFLKKFAKNFVFCVFNNLLR